MDCSFMELYVIWLGRILLYVVCYLILYVASLHSFCYDHPHELSIKCLRFDEKYLFDYSNGFGEYDELVFCL